MTSDTRGTLSDLAYLVACHKATGCLWQSADYGARVRNDKWDQSRLDDGVRFLVRKMEDKESTS